jgi:hypothetical protein
MYQVMRSGQRYTVVHDGEPARSALGQPFTTAYRLLADDLCGELNRHAPAPRAETSPAFEP